MGWSFNYILWKNISFPYGSRKERKFEIISMSELDFVSLCINVATFMSQRYFVASIPVGVFHLPRDSGNSGWVVNGTCFFGSFHWKISGKNGTSEKVVPFSRWKLFRWNCVFHLRVSQGLTSSRPFTTMSSVRKYGGILLLPRSVTSFSSSSTLYECSVCHGLAPDF